jgi:hypothetical protein
MGFSLLGKIGGVGHTAPQQVASHKLGQEEVKLLQAHGVKLPDDAFKGNAAGMERLNHLLQALKKGGPLSMADTQTLNAMKAAHDHPRTLHDVMK